MNGLLHRLAARTAGTIVQLRSDARLPFGGIELRPDGAADDLKEQATLIDSRAQPSNPSGAPVQSRQGSPSRPPTRSRTPAPMVTQSPQRRGATPVDARPPVALEAHTALRAVSPAAASHVEVPSEGMSPGLRSRRVLEPAPAEAGRASHDLAVPAGAARRSATQPDDAPRLIGEPSLLMPPAAADSSVSRGIASTVTRHPAGPSSTVPAIATEESNEVHINIGRIEVTAVHDAAPVQRRPPPAAPPMTLDAYLAKRGRS